jgi:hypothetical protein
LVKASKTSRKLPPRRGVEVQPVRDAVPSDVGDQGVGHVGVVVPVVQRSGAGEEVDPLAPLGFPDQASPSECELDRVAAAVAPHLGLTSSRAPLLRRTPVFDPHVRVFEMLMREART